MAEIVTFTNLLFDGSYIQQVPSQALRYQVNMTFFDVNEDTPGCSVEVEIPAGYTVIRTWEVVGVSNISGVTVGQSGTGPINIPFTIIDPSAGAEAGIVINYTDTITAGPVDSVYQTLAVYFLPPEITQTAPSPAGGSPVYLYASSCGNASLIRNDRATLVGALDGDGGALAAYSDTIFEVGTIPGVYTMQQEAPFSPENPAAFTELMPNTTYYWRYRIVSVLPNLVPEGTVLYTSPECGSFTTLPNDTRAECASDRNEVHSHQISMFGSALGLPVGDFVRFVVSDSPTGPWEPGDPSVVFLGSNRPIVTGTNPETFRHTVPHDGLHLQPDTDYYWVLQHIASDGVTILTQSPEVCHVTTRAAGDENYIRCDPNPIANQSGRTTAFSRVPVPDGSEDFPASLINDRIQVDVGPSATGPWTLATNYAGLGGSIATNTPGANPTGGVSPSGGLVSQIGNLIHNTQYWARHTLFNVGEPSLNPIQEVVCGPFVTNDRPNPRCADQIQNIGHRTANLRFLAGTTTDRENPGGPATRSVFAAGDVVTVEVATVSGGPYTVAGSVTLPNAPNQFSGSAFANVDLSGLTPDTEYFYRVRCTEAVETGGQYWLSPECAVSFTTLPLPNCETITVSEITSINAKVVVEPRDWLAGDDVRLLVSTSPMGPFAAALVHTVAVTNEPITFDFLNLLQPARTYYHQVEIDHQPETGIPDYFSPVCQFTTAGGMPQGAWTLGEPRCMEECSPGSTPVTITKSGCGCS